MEGHIYIYICQFAFLDTTFLLWKQRIFTVILLQMHRKLLVRGKFMRDTGVTHKLLFKVQNLAFSLIKPFSYLGLRRDKGHLLKE